LTEVGRKLPFGTADSSLRGALIVGGPSDRLGGPLRRVGDLKVSKKPELQRPSLTGHRILPNKVTARRRKGRSFA
jgi:hypothetical protein